MKLTVKHIPALPKVRPKERLMTKIASGLTRFTDLALGYPETFTYLRELAEEGLICRVSGDVRSLGYKRIQRKPNAYTLTPKGWEWVNDYVKSINDKLEAAEHGY